MSQPTTYVRQYSFSSFQTANPDDPLPGQKVDLELNTIKTTLDQVLVNLALIQRDDGEIGNSLIGVEQMDGVLISLGFDRPAPWATATSYLVDSAVFQSDKLYVCLVAHTSGTFATDLAALKWVLVVDFTTLIADAEAARDAADVFAAEAEASAIASAASAAVALPKAGGTMTGPIVISGDAGNNTHAPNLGQVQSGIVQHATVVGGTVDAITLTHVPVRVGPMAAGTRGIFTAAGANTSTTPTINSDGIGAAVIKKFNLAALAAGDIVGAGHEVEWEFNGTNYIILNPAQISTANFAALAGANVFTADQTITSSDSGATVGPNLVGERISTTPAVNDLLFNIIFRGRDSGANAADYASIFGKIIDPTDASEDGQLLLQTIIAGTSAARWVVGAGVFTLNATGGDKGVDTINAGKFYDDGVELEDWRLISTTTISASASVDVINLSAFSRIRVELDNIMPATDGANIYVRLSSDNGSTFLATNYTGFNAIGGSEPAATDTGVAMCLDFNVGVGNAGTDGGLGATVDIVDFNAAQKTKAFGSIVTFDVAGAMTGRQLAWSHSGQTAMNAARVIASTGNLTSGTVKVYGRV